MMKDAGVAIWNRTNLVPGPNIEDLINEIEESKTISPCSKPNLLRGHSSYKQKADELGPISEVICLHSVQTKFP